MQVGAVFVAAWLLGWYQRWYFQRRGRSFPEIRVVVPWYAGEVLDLFGFPAGADVHGGLWWRTDDRRITFYADCSDTFAIGAADVEEITEADMPLLRACRADLRAHSDVEWLLPVLYAARKRGTVPPEWWFDSEPDAPRSLFVMEGRGV